MKLIEPTMEYDKQIRAYRQEFLVTGNEGSRKTILNNAGVYKSTVYEPGKKVY